MEKLTWQGRLPLKRPEEESLNKEMQKEWLKKRIPKNLPEKLEALS